MKTLNDMRGAAHSRVDEAADSIEEWTERAENGLENGVEDAEDYVEEAIGGGIPWMKILGVVAAGAVVAGGILYLSRHRAQRLLLEKGLKRGLHGGAELALHLPGGLRRARESADSLARESARLWDKIPVRVVMK